MAAFLHSWPSLPLSGHTRYVQLFIAAGCCPSSATSPRPHWPRYVRKIPQTVVPFEPSIPLAPRAGLSVVTLPLYLQPRRLTGTGIPPALPTSTVLQGTTATVPYPNCSPSSSSTSPGRCRKSLLRPRHPRRSPSAAAPPSLPPSLAAVSLSSKRYMVSRAGTLSNAVCYESGSAHIWVRHSLHLAPRPSSWQW